MRVAGEVLLMLFILASIPALCAGQCTSDIEGCNPGVPNLVKFNGTLKNAAGVPHTGTVAIRFVIYGESTGGTGLWQEVQNAQLDRQGNYEVMLGAASQGIPADLFTSGSPRWLGVQALLPGEEEQSRVLLVSVPYALQAGNAQTLGGLPASAFAPAGANVPVSGAASTTATTSASAIAGTAVIANTASDAGIGRVTTPGGTADTIPKFSGLTSTANSQITDQNGVVSMKNLSNALFAERFPGGVPDAVAACPANGCIIYAVSPNVNLNLGTIDPGYKAITLYLGPYTFTVQQVTLRKGLKIIGMGASGGTIPSVACSVAAPCNGTTLQSVNGNNPIFVIPQVNNEPATDVLLTGFRVYGSAGNTNEDAFFLDTSTTVDTGLWYSTLDDIFIAGFAGTGMHIRGRPNDFHAATQWVLFNNVVVFRNAGGANGLRMEGGTFELRFRNCEFDGAAIGDGTNIYMGGLPGGGVSGYPMTIVFEGLISQSAATAVQIDGGINISFYGSHHEEIQGAYHITNQTSISTKGLTIADSNFVANVGINNGAGYELNVDTTTAAGIFFMHNRIFGTPDWVVKSTNLSSVVYQDNMLYGSTGNGPATSGITTQVVPATSINILGVHSVGLNTSSTPITTIQSGLGPGEMVTLFTLGGPVTFAAGGNIDLMGLPTLTLNGTITFIRSDLGALLWKPVSTWIPEPSAVPLRFIGGSGYGGDRQNPQ